MTIMDRQNLENIRKDISRETDLKALSILQKKLAMLKATIKKMEDIA